MYQKDYILRMIEACSIALARIIGLKEKGKNRLALEEVKRVYDEMLKVNIEKILHLSGNQLQGIEMEKLEMIADVLKVEAEIEYLEDHHEKSLELFKKAYDFLILVDQKHNTFSFERKNKITELENLIK